MSVSVRVRLEGPLAADLEKTHKRAVPYALRNGLNATAFAARKLWQTEMAEAFVLRNTWTTRRIFVEKATLGTRGAMQAVVMSPNGNLVKQEAGGVEHHAVPTGVASGEGRGANPRKALVRKGFKVGAIQLGQRPSTGSRRQRNAAAIRMAASKGQKFVYLELPTRKGLFLLRGGKRNPRVDMLWDTTSKAHRVPAHPTLGPAMRKLEAVAPRLMTSALLDQLRRNKVFGY